MEQRTLVRWLKILVIFASVCGIAICVGILPMVGKRMIEVYPEFFLLLSSLAHFFMDISGSLFYCTCFGMEDF